MLATLSLILCSQGTVQKNKSRLESLQNKLAVTSSRSKFIARLKNHGVDSYYERPFRLANSKLWVFPLLDTANKFLSPGRVVLADPSGGRHFRLSALVSLDPLGSCLPEVGFLKDNNIVLAGLTGWWGNGPDGAVVLLKKTNNGWAVSKQHRTKFQYIGVTLKHAPPAWIVTITGRDYPMNINVSHAMANVEMVQRIVYTNGGIVVEQAHRTMNPQAILDVLAGAAAKKDFPLVRKYCATPGLARQIYRLGNQLKETGWGVPGSICSTGNTKFQAEDLKLQFDFGKRSGHWILIRICNI